MTEQPFPTPGRQSVPPILREWFDDVSERQTVKGIATYGQPVMSWNGRHAFQDALEEWFDLGIYLTQLHLEHADLLEENAALRARVAELEGRDG